MGSLSVGAGLAVRLASPPPTLYFSRREEIAHGVPTGKVEQFQMTVEPKCDDCTGPAGIDGDLCICEVAQKRIAQDTGERISLEDLLKEFPFDEEGKGVPPSGEQQGEEEEGIILTEYKVNKITMSNRINDGTAHAREGEGN